RAYPLRQQPDSRRDRGPGCGACLGAREKSARATDAPERLVQGTRLPRARAEGRGRAHGRARADHRRAISAGIEGTAYSLARGESEDAGRRAAGARGLRPSADDVDGGGQAPAQHARDRERACPRAVAEPAAVRKLPASLKITVPLILLGFAVALSALNLIYQLPRAERMVEADHREHLLQELSRLQSTLEYLLLKGDIEGARREVAILASNRNYTVVALTDDQNSVIAATRRAWLGRPAAEVLPKLESEPATGATVGRGARVILESDKNALLGYVDIPMGAGGRALRGSRMGRLFFDYDLERAKYAARRQIVAQARYWTGWVTALAIALWIVFHFLLTRRTDQLVRAAEQLAAGNLAARSALRGRDELARLSRAFDVMASEVAHTQTRLQQDIAKRIEVQQALRASEELYRVMFNGSIDGLALWNLGGEIVDINPTLWRMYGYSDEEFHARNP